MVGWEVMRRGEGRYAAFQELVKAMFVKQLVGVRMTYNPFLKHRDVDDQERSTTSPLQDLFEFVRPPGAPSAPGTIASAYATSCIRLQRSSLAEMNFCLSVCPSVCVQPSDGLRQQHTAHVRH